MTGDCVGPASGKVTFTVWFKAWSGRQVGENRATIELVAPEFGSERVVYVPSELVDLLAQHVQRAGVEQGDWMIADAGQPLNRNSAGHPWRGVRKATGLGGYTLHDLRYFYASGLIASGCDVVTVQRALGHSWATITLGVYSRRWPTAEDRTRAAAGDLMAAALGASADSLRTKELDKPLSSRDVSSQR